MRSFDVPSIDLPSIDLPSIDLRGLGAYIREQRSAAQVSVRELARVAGVSNPYLSQIERGLKKPSAEILNQIARGLRISAESLYIRAGLLDERPGDLAVVAAVEADPTLSDRQRHVLLEIYAAFQHGNAARTDAADAAPSVAPSRKDS